MKQEQTRYLLLDSKGTPLSRAVLLSPAEAHSWQVRLLDDKMEQVLEHEVVQLVSMAEDAPSLLGRITGHREDWLAVEKLRPLGAQARQNLRVPVGFRSYIYPVSGKWIGRCAVKGNDLSCGGISFFCTATLIVGEWIEIVIPIAIPLVLTCEVLRAKEEADGQHFYAGKFIDICNDEETLVREAVFNIQIRRRS